MTSLSGSSSGFFTGPAKHPDERPFLRAHWKWLIMANYVCDPAILQDWLPAGTELDSWNNNCLISLVGFQFHDTRVRGIRFPFHQHFEEINLRFYVRRKENGIIKRGVVFIREFVPRPLISLVANSCYGENYKTLSTQSKIYVAGDQLNVCYEWKDHGARNMLRVEASPGPEEIVKNSEAEYVLEHYWGYVKRGNSVTTEYQVLHPRWQVHPVLKFEVKADFAELYGSGFSFLSTREPCSVFLAGGSPVSVYKGRKIKT